MHEISQEMAKIFREGEDKVQNAIFQHPGCTARGLNNIVGMNTGIYLRILLAKCRIYKINWKNRGVCYYSRWWD
ncbi:MAG: hypothetical protein NTZ42_01485 [Candidatus Gribaldobacteria bacterium]|nr:hypothetical protein [Candidatus Gribaldobacteria bacterium]